jgi:hypothetical protein
MQPKTGEHSFLDQLGWLIVSGEAERLLGRLHGISTGRFESSDMSELAALVHWMASSTEPAIWSLTIDQHQFSNLPDEFRSVILTLLSAQLENAASPTGHVRVFASSILQLVESSNLLRMALQAVSRGLNVRVLAGGGPQFARPLEVVLSAPSGSLLISARPSTERFGAVWSIEAVPAASVAPANNLTSYPGSVGAEALLSLPPGPDAPSTPTPAGGEVEASVADLFGELICLRDLQPRSSRLRGLDALRTPLRIAAPFVPRKNEREYASVVQAFVNDLVGPDSCIIYIGDTLLNDGSVISNLASASRSPVFGFLCSEKGFGTAEDFILGPIYFARRWQSLSRFLAQGRRHGMTIDARTVALFDLDQTVYAAKGRDDGPLREARWEAIHSFLRDTIPSYKFDADRAERIYRKFDQDEYHHITRDNMDYVILLVLAVASGLCDVGEIEAFAASDNNSIASLTELLHQRTLARQNHEDIGRVLDVIRAVHYNTLANDQTPCKEFRRYECLSTALRMRSQDGQAERSRILLNREVVDFIRFLKEQRACLFAISDRPVEAAVAEDEDQVVDLMSIRMKSTGVPIYHLL